jgi:hypothetical protein
MSLAGGRVGPGPPSALKAGATAPPRLAVLVSMREHAAEGEFRVFDCQPAAAPSR